MYVLLEVLKNVHSIRLLQLLSKACNTMHLLFNIAIIIMSV